MEHLRYLFMPLNVNNGSWRTITLVCIGNLAYFFGLMFGTLSILQHFGIV